MTNKEFAKLLEKRTKQFAIRILKLESTGISFFKKVITPLKQKG